MIHKYTLWSLPNTELGGMDMEQRSTDGDNVEDGQWKKLRHWWQRMRKFTTFGLALHLSGTQGMCTIKDSHEKGNEMVYSK